LRGQIKKKTNKNIKKKKKNNNQDNEYHGMCFKLKMMKLKKNLKESKERKITQKKEYHNWIFVSLFFLSR